MNDKPVTPTRIIPAGAALPARPPAPREAPPWRPPPPAVPPPPDPPPVAQVHHTHEIVLTWTPPEPEPSRWERLTAWLGRYIRPWHAAIGLTTAVLPIPGTGYSAATTWHYTVGLARDSFGAGWGYSLGAVPLALAVSVIVRRGGSPLRLFALTVTGIGALGALSWWDPIQMITGVQK
ncbi:hypothetical protein AB0D49_08305 [Streptomyces sp. NPDC048290]|uniref:hypothetical protein n=1 Tax=Streptomyces sp. NPDC048290 TaxID=3155811 RepID=UPI003435C10C